MGLRAPPTEAPPAYRFVTRVCRRDLRPVVIGMCLVTAIWALAWTVSSFKALKLANSEGEPKLAPLAIAQGVIYAVACAFQVYGLIVVGMQRLTLVKLYTFMCALSTLLVIGAGVMRVVVHFVFKYDLIQECIVIAQTGTIGSVFGIWGSSPATHLNKDQATQYCNDEWNHDSWAEIIGLILEIMLGLLFTAIAFAYYRQALDPSSAANTSRLPSNQARRDGYHPSYNPPYDETAYTPVYLPPPGPPPADGKPPEYKRASYLSYAEHKDAKEYDPFSDYDGPSIPMPTHWVEDRDVRSPPRV